MNKVFKYQLLLIAVLMLLSSIFISSCGSKRNPTGGKLDVDKPAVLASIPEEYKEISDQKIELTFSKPIDRTTFIKGVYIYPPVVKKKFDYESNIVTIKFLEALAKDTNYYVTLTSRIKDVRGNAMAANQTLIYKHGTLQTNKISGNITYEKPADNGLPVSLNLLAADSLWVLAKNIAGASYSLEALNPMKYILKAYIDKNLNGRYDPESEPYSEFNIPNQPIANYDLNMAYADTVKPAIKIVRAISNQEYEITLNKTIKSFQKVLIHTVNKKRDLQILGINHENDKITVLTAPTDTTKWVFNLLNAVDNKGNANALSTFAINGTDKPDKIAPTVVKTNPRNGASVNNLQPVLEVTFSEVILPDRFKANLKEVEANQLIPFKIVSVNGKTFQIQPIKPLINYRTYMLMIDNSTADISGNRIAKDFNLVFLPIFRTANSPQ
jgi:hypothetical protein